MRFKPQASQRRRRQLRLDVTCLEERMLLSAPGSLDTSFNPTGTPAGTAVVVFPSDRPGSSIGNAVAVQPDGKILIAGQAFATSTNTLAVTRLNTDGSLDTTFASAGYFSLAAGPTSNSNTLNAILLQPDGRILLAGKVNLGTGDQFLILRLDPDGRLDPSFDFDGAVVTDVGTGGDVAYALAIQPDGKILAAGQTGVNGANDMAIVRYNFDGEIDTTFSRLGKFVYNFSAGSNDTLNAILVQPDGKIVAGGSGRAVNRPNNDFALIRLNPNGSFDPLFGTAGRVTTDFGGDDRIYGLAVQSNGRLVAVGSVPGTGGRNFGLARYSLGGSLDPTFGSRGIVNTDINSLDDVARSVAIDVSGQIIVGGTSGVPGATTPAQSVARFTTFGALDIRFGRQGRTITSIFGGPGDGTGLALAPDGKIVVAGSTRIGTFTVMSVARYDTRTTPPVDFSGNSVSDFGRYTYATAQWSILLSGQGTVIEPFYGAANLDIPVPGDYDGDGKADLAVFRPTTAQWFIQPSGGGAQIIRQFGDTDLRDIPTPGDFDGDGIYDTVIFRPATGQWLGMLTGGSFLNQTFGATNLVDIPISGDFDGDGRFDLSVFRPSTAQWFIRQSSNGSLFTASYGDTDLRDVPTPGDYDGDGRTDLSVFRVATGEWFIKLWNGAQVIRFFGPPGLAQYPLESPIGALVRLGTASTASSASTMSASSGSISAASTRQSTESLDSTANPSTTTSLIQRIRQRIAARFSRRR